MRIVGGEFRGTKLYLPNNKDIRPTPERVKEAVFNILGANIKGALFLDLYAGSGSMGLEALSRGASVVTMVELEHMEVIRKNSVRCGINNDKKLKVIHSPAQKAINVMLNLKDRYDLIYVDPPWHSKNMGDNALRALGLLSPSGILMLEAFKKTNLPDPNKEYKLYDSSKYGDTVIHFYRNEVDSRKNVAP